MNIIGTGVSHSAVTAHKIHFSLSYEHEHVYCFVEPNDANIR